MPYYNDGHYKTTQPYNDTYLCDATQVVTRENAKGLLMVRYEESGGKYKYAILSLTNPITYNPNNSAESNLDTWNGTGGISWSGSTNEETGQQPTYPTNASSQPIINGWQGLGRRVWGFSTTEHSISDLNIPLFNINDESSINRYVNDGDDGGAVNYDDLHPSILHTKIWLDGEAYYNIYIMTSTDNETYIANGHCDISMLAHTGNILHWTITETVKESYKFNETKLYPYSQYAVDQTNKLKIEIYPKPDGETSVGYYGYVDFKMKDGKIDGEYTISDGANGRHTIEVVYGTPEESDYPTDDPPTNHDPTTNDFSGSNTLTKTYCLDQTEIRTLGNFLWSATFKDNILGICSSPLENVVSIKAMPISESLLTGDEESVKIGNVQAPITTLRVDKPDKVTYTVGQKRIPRTFGNFIDYTETVLSIYLPFIGFKPLDNLVYMGRTLLVEYIYDCILGNVLAVLKVKKDNSNTFLTTETYQANCGVDISLSSTNRAQIENGYINSALSVVSDIVSGNVLGATQDAFNGMTQQFHTQSTGVGNPSLMGAMDMKCFVMIKRPQKYVPPKTSTGLDIYGHTVGYPCYLTMKLKDLKIQSPDPQHIRGCFFKVKNFNASEIPQATYEEKERLKALLESGVILYDR